jgi:hypothetical protein
LLFLTASAALLYACAYDAAAAPANRPSFSAANLPNPQVKQLGIEAPKRILFVGNSYLYYNDSLHNHVKRMGEAAGLFEQSPAIYKSATIGGAELRDHAIDHLIDHTNLRVEKPFEAVVMQGISSAALTANSRKRFKNAATANARKIRKAGGQPVLYMTPAYADYHRRYSASMTAETASLYIETGNEIGALVIPVGLAFDEAKRRRPDLVLHKPFDGSHPELIGTYLAAATVMASLYGTSPVGNGYDYFGEISKDDALFAQQVAHDTVTQFFGRELK